MMKNIRLLLITGQFALFFGLTGFLVNYLFLDNNPYLAFTTGVLLGLSLVFNMAFLLSMKKNTK